MQPTVTELWGALAEFYRRGWKLEDAVRVVMTAYPGCPSQRMVEAANEIWTWDNLQGWANEPAKDAYYADHTLMDEASAMVRTQRDLNDWPIISGDICFERGPWWVQWATFLVILICPKILRQASESLVDRAYERGLIDSKAFHELRALAARCFHRG